MEFLPLFLRPYFAGKPMVMSRNVGCFHSPPLAGHSPIVTSPSAVACRVTKTIEILGVKKPLAAQFLLYPTKDSRNKKVYSLKLH